MSPRTPLRRAEWIGAIVIFLALGLMVFVLNVPSIRTTQCDGSVPTWMITEENVGTGCVELLSGPPPPEWQGSWICIGLCGEPNPTPYFPEPEP